ncbi:hypothetical protein HMPREF1550_01859, partial [Actinomyces sp. oral taxon 877 str. F0543]
RLLMDGAAPLPGPSAPAAPSPSAGRSRAGRGWEAAPCVPFRKSLQ